MDAPLLADSDGALRLSGGSSSLSSVNERDRVLGGERPAADSLTGVLAQLQQNASAEDAKESLDFDSDYDQRRRWSSLAHERKCWGYSGASLTQWILTLVLGVSVGLIAFVMKQGIEELQLAKVSAIERLLNPCAESAAACADLGEQEQREALRPGLALCVFCAVNAALATTGALLTVCVAPEAAGSGIPEVMGYLNGVHVQKIMRLRTLGVKVVGSFLAVCSGLAVGVLGPLVHSGAIVGSGLTRGHKIWRGCGGRLEYKCRVRMMERFHNDADRRDFISMGAAVGFAAAFGAPVGGVLFALEEAASFWDAKLMVRPGLC
jgi:H+/Cl- antiporter ClcA